MAFGVSHLLLRAIVLKSIVGTQMVTEAVLQTLLTEVERELNGCAPLIQMNHTFFSQLIALHNAEEDYFLTPHIRLEEQTSSIEESGGKCNFWRICFWKRWLQEYLPTLQVREKWQIALSKLKPNALILLVDENALRGRWNLGRVCQKLSLLENDYENL